MPSPGKQIRLYVPPSLHEETKAVAKAHGLSMSQIARAGVRGEVERLKRVSPKKVDLCQAQN